MSISMRFFALTSITFITCISSLNAQERVPTVVLSEPEAALGEPFSDVRGVRELSDGTVMVSDMLERALRRVDFANGSFEEIGRTGQGPGEYQMPGELLPLPGDSSLLVDFGNMRVTVVGPDGKLGDSDPLMRPDGLFVMPRGIDVSGRIYIEMSNFQLGQGREIPDSFAIARIDRATGAVDTVGYLPRPEAGRVQSMGGGGASFTGAGLSPFQAMDAWATAPNGSIAVARHADYHLEWVFADGEPVVGPTVDYRPVNITREDKEAWASRMSGGTVTAISTSGGGGRSMSMPRPDIDEIDFPEYKPAFPRGAVSVTPEGEAWVQRHAAHGEPETYDVFDASGRRIEQVVLAAGRELVGFGHGTLYAVYVDDDDLQWLERYRR
jgi:hypothetical protein